jgi:hypothetical protein
VLAVGFLLIAAHLHLTPTDSLIFHMRLPEPISHLLNSKTIRSSTRYEETIRHAFTRFHAAVRVLRVLPHPLAPHHFVDMSTNTPVVMTKGTVLVMCLDRTLAMVTKLEQDTGPALKTFPDQEYAIGQLSTLYKCFTP